MGNDEQRLMESHLPILPHPSGLLIGSKWKQPISLIFHLGQLQGHQGWKHQSLMEHLEDLWKSYYRTMRPRCRPITWMDMHFLLSGMNLNCFSFGLDCIDVYTGDSFPWNDFLRWRITAFRMDYGEWTENSRGTYNKWDGIARTTAQVYLSLFWVLVCSVLYWFS